MEEISRSLSFICESRSNSYLFRRLQSWHFVGVFSVLVQRHFKSHARKKTKGVYILNEQYLTRHHHERRRMSSRRKNPHPKRAVNARTVLKVKEEQPPVLCSRIPDEDDDLEANHHQIQKEETTFIENKRGRLSREAGLPEDSDRELCAAAAGRKNEKVQTHRRENPKRHHLRQIQTLALANPVPRKTTKQRKERSEEKERARVRCVREGVWISIIFGQTHAYSHERETVRM